MVDLLIPIILEACVATTSEVIRRTQKTRRTSCKRTAAMEFSPEDRVLQRGLIVKHQSEQRQVIILVLVPPPPKVFARKQ